MKQAILVWVCKCKETNETMETHRYILISIYPIYSYIHIQDGLNSAQFYMEITWKIWRFLWQPCMNRCINDWSLEFLAILLGLNVSLKVDFIKMLRDLAALVVHIMTDCTLKLHVNVTTHIIKMNIMYYWGIASAASYLLWMKSTRLTRCVQIPFLFITLTS